MTDEEINIAIAKIISYKPAIILRDFNGDPFPGWDEPPNYAGNLNMMYAAEEFLGEDMDNWLRYDKFLAEITSSFSWHAKAREKAEAFLRTFNEWKE